MAVNPLAYKVSQLEGFAGVAEEKITRLENRLSEIERKLKEAEAEIKRLKAKG